MAKVFIWDMDGTLIDSYAVIVASMKETYRCFGIDVDADEIRNHVMKYSCGSFIELMEKRTGKPFADMQDKFNLINEAENKKIGLVKNAGDTLKTLISMGHRQFIFTHRGPSTFEILKKCEADGLFDEIVTKLNGFKRKPEPDALLYLIDKYKLDKENTFYVGDRSLDMECAANAGIGGILYLPDGSVTEPVGTENYIVKDLAEIPGLFSENTD